MAGQGMQQAAAEEAQRTPVGTIHVVDPHPLKWLFITWNTMEESVRTDERGHIVGAVMENSRWIDQTTFEVDIREGIRFQDGEECTAHSFKRAFDEGAALGGASPTGDVPQLPPGREVEVVDDHRVRMNFPAQSRP